jgi:proline iminopeptidase
MPHIQVRGVDHYFEWIKTPAPGENKPVMVFIHGWGGSARYWESTGRALAQEFDCLLYDLRGFGRSPLPSSPTGIAYEMEDYAEDLAAFLDALQVGQIYINAHSMGASVATVFINLYPERVERAILTCSGVFEYDANAFAAFHKFGGYVVKFRPRWLGKIPLADKMFMARFLHQPLSRDISRAFLQDFLMASYDAALGTILTSVSQRSSEVMPKEFARLKVPTLLVAGEHDIIIPAAMGRQAAALNEKVEFVEIPDTAHFPMLEAPAAYLERVLDFLGVGKH